MSDGYTSTLPCGCDPELNWRCSEHWEESPDYATWAQKKIIAFPLGTERVAELRASRPLPRNEAFHALLTRMGETHDKKNQDYADTANGRYYSNFESAAQVAGCTVDTVFRVLIGIKLARLDELLKGKEAQNESLEDSLLDLSVYSALWASWRSIPHDK
jgi:hypothetical protein